jgi:hypothetical protein
MPAQRTPKAPPPRAHREALKLRDKARDVWICLETDTRGSRLGDEIPSRRRRGARRLGRADGQGGEKVSTPQNVVRYRRGGRP